ncbi:MAG: hypothetical protein RR904_04835 [Bacilli bacterium]
MDVVEEKDSNQIEVEVVEAPEKKKIESSIKNNTEYVVQKKKKKWPRIVIIIIFYIVFFRIIQKQIIVDDLIEKSKLHGIILKIFEKEKVKLDVLKSIIESPNNYTLEEIEKTSTTIFNSNREGKYYEKPISLKTVLIELRNKEYIKEKESTAILNKLEATISELEKVSPIDKLLTNQKEHFYNIKTKLNEEEYNLVKSDLDKIMGELELKNKLIDKYLANSDTSYMMAIISLIFATISLIPVVSWAVTGTKQAWNFIKSFLKGKKVGGQNE